MTKEMEEIPLHKIRDTVFDAVSLLAGNCQKPEIISGECAL